MYRRLTLTLIVLLCATSLFAQENLYKHSDHPRKVKLLAYPATGAGASASASASASVQAEASVAEASEAEASEDSLSAPEGSMAIIVCPGGSYFWLDKEHEGEDVALWLQSNNISAYVLHYRTAGFVAFITHLRWVIRGRRYPDPQDDLRDAMIYLKKNSEKLNISPEEIGLMGFSAGGHLVMSSVELFDDTLQPAFIASIYPVVTMDGNYVHKRSRRALLGENKKRNKILRDSLSLERHIPADCPPVFLVNCKDDPVVKYQNSELLDEALTEKNIEHKYIQYKTGGHGFGASDDKGSKESRGWKDEFLEWLDELNL